jgi:hypothetical protein
MSIFLLIALVMLLFGFIIQISKVLQCNLNIVFLESFREDVFLLCNCTSERLFDDNYYELKHFIKIKRAKYNKITLKKINLENFLLKATTRPLDFIIANLNVSENPMTEVFFAKEIPKYLDGFQTEINENIGLYQIKRKDNFFNLFNPFILINNVYSFLISSLFAQFKFNTPSILKDLISMTGTIISSIWIIMQIFNFLS